MKTMVLKNPKQPISAAHIDSKVYKPNPKTGEFQVEDGHVEVLRSHGLMLKGEVTSEQHKAALAAQGDASQAEVDRLKAVLAAAGLDENGKALPKKA